MLTWILLFVLSSAEAREAQAYAPDLTRPETKAEAQLDVLEGLVRGGLTADALKVSAQLRAEGMKGARFDILQAEVMHATGLTSQALDMLRAVTRKEPKNAAAWAMLGIVLSDHQETEEAVAALERARRLTPDDAAVLNNLGYLQMARGQNQRAVDLFEQAIIQDPSSLRSRNNLGFAFARLEKDMDALAAFRSASSESDARYNMGVACELRGDTTSALTNYQAAVAANAQHSSARTALARLLHTESP